MARGRRGSVTAARKLRQQRRRRQRQRRGNAARTRAIRGIRPFRRSTATRSAPRWSVRGVKRTAKIVVAMGGSSAEREVSLRSGESVMRALETLGYQAAALDYDDGFVEAVRERKPDAVFNALHGP